MNSDITHCPPPPIPIDEKHPFTNELASLLNRHSIDNDLNTPDFIIADMVVKMLEAIRIANTRKQLWRAPLRQEIINNQAPNNA